VLSLSSEAKASSLNNGSGHSSSHYKKITPKTFQRDLAIEDKDAGPSIDHDGCPYLLATDLFVFSPVRHERFLDWV
jgi:hypothetical protein